MSQRDSVRVPEQGVKTQWSWENRERLTSHPRPEGSHEGVLGATRDLVRVEGSRGRTQQSWRAREDSRRVPSQRRAMSESRESHNRLSRVKKQGVRLS